MSRFRIKQIEASAYGEDGYFDAVSQCQYVFARANRHIDESSNVYVLGSAGVDGIDFVLKPDDDAVYARRPIDDELVPLAPDFDSFILGWINGSITV